MPCDELSNRPDRLPSFSAHNSACHRSFIEDVFSPFFLKLGSIADVAPSPLASPPNSQSAGGLKVSRLLVRANPCVRPRLDHGTATDSGNGIQGKGLSL